MHIDPSFSERVTSFGTRVAGWRNAINKMRNKPEEALLEMETAAEELRSAEEEIRHQNEELLATQSQLEDERRRYRDLFEMAPDGYVVTDQRAVITEANRAAGRMLGMRQQFLAGKSLLLFFHADDVRTARHQMTLSQQTQTPAEWTARITPRAATSYTAGITVAPILERTEHHGLHAVGFRWQVRDISDRIRAEMNARALADEIEELRARQSSMVQSERADLSVERAARKNAEADTRAKDAFLALVAHELRNPLLPIQIAVDSLLSSKNIDPSQYREKLQIIQRNLAAERRLIDDLLDVTRIMHGKLDLQRETIRLRPIIEEILSESRDALAAKDITLHVDLAAGNPHLHADPIRLRQIFWNLLNNAVKFTPAKGRIFVRSSLHPLRNEVIVEIEDTGMGIPRSTLQHLFDPFQQGDSRFARTQGGLGLGLSIVRSLVTAHNGSVSIDSQGVGKGAIVRVNLPTVEQPAPSSRKKHPAGPAAPAKDLVIALVDDHIDSVRAMSHIITALGHQVLTAHTIADAVKLLSARSVDLLISDLNLPDGSGADILRTVPPTHVKRAIALSGTTGRHEQALCRTAGFEKLIAKPISMELLRELLHNPV
jgi:PAS domain S-box-containing protein